MRSSHILRFSIRSRNIFPLVRLGLPTIRSQLKEFSLRFGFFVIFSLVTFHSRSTNQFKVLHSPWLIPSIGFTFTSSTRLFLTNSSISSIVFSRSTYFSNILLGNRSPSTLLEQTSCVRSFTRFFRFFHSLYSFLLWLSGSLSIYLLNFLPKHFTVTKSSDQR